MSKTVRIENVNDLKTVAAEHGVKVPEGRGRPPRMVLFKALTDAGVTIDPTPYFDADGNGGRSPKSPTTPRAKAAPKSSAAYVVSVRLPQTAKGEVRRFSATGKNPELAGKPIPQSKISRHTITAADIREFARSQGEDVGERGRPSTAFTVPAAADAAGWGDVADLTVVSVERA